jgi:diadenosine tetraphosphatase ApaH/serine/threonine PP2A family protein phosphatase
MRLAIVSDIHANWQAWRAVLRDMQEQGVDGMLCLGDIVGYGPRPADVLEDVLSRCENFVLGNHDAVIPNRLDPEIFSDQAREAIEWTRGKLDASASGFFGQLPLVMVDDDILCVHAEAEDPGRYDYIFEPEDALPTFRASSARLILCGHTHIPGVFAYDEETGGVTSGGPASARLLPEYRYLVNVGSVGDPRDGRETACYCILDRESQYVDFRRVPFDHAAYRRQLAATGLTNLPYFLQVLDRRDAAVSRLSDMDTGRLKRSQRPASSHAHTAQIHVDPGLLQQARSRRLVVPERKAMRTRTKVIAGLSCLAAMLILGVGLAWFTAYDRKTRYLPVTRRVGERQPAGRHPESPVPPPTEEGTAPAVPPRVDDDTIVAGAATPDAVSHVGPDEGPAPTPVRAEPVPDPEPAPAPEPVALREPVPEPEPVTPRVAARVPLPAVDGLLAYEGFDYPHGNLAGKDGGAGWAGAWEAVAGNSGSVVAGSLKPDGPVDLIMTGNRTLQIQDSRSGRHLDTSKGGVFDGAGYLNGAGDIGARGKTLYVSFLQRPEKQGRFWEFEFHRDNLNDRGRVSGIGNDHNHRKVHLRGPHNPVVGPAETDVSLYVVRIDFVPGNDDVYVFRNPPVDAEPDAGEASVKAKGFQNMTFDGISLGAFCPGAAVEHDEIRIGETYASVMPPAGGVPAGVALAILGREFERAAVELAARNPAHPDLNAVRELERRLTDVERTILASFKSDVGRQVSVQLARGPVRSLRIEGVSGQKITCTLEGGQKKITKDLMLRDLHLKERLYRLGGADSPVAWVYHGLLALDGGRPDVARQSFAELGGELGEALVAGVDRRLLTNAREGLAELLTKAGVPADAEGLGEAAKGLADATLSTIARQRLLKALKHHRSECERRLGALPAEFDETLKKLESVVGAVGRYGGAAPVSHWTMDGLSMTALKDKVGARHGAFAGSVERRPGRSRGALEFGGWGHVEISKVTGLVSGDAMTWAAWIKTTESGTIAALTSSGGARPRGDRVFYVEGKKLAFGIGHIGIVRSETEVADGKWHHVAVVLEGPKAVRFHIDGEPDGGGDLPHKAGDLPAGCVFKIGATEKVSDTKPGFNGLIDDVICYDRPLSPPELTSLYEKQK